MRIVGRDKLDEFVGVHADARPWITHWIADTEAARWGTSADIKRSYTSASFLAKNVVIFNVKGNRYRLEVQVAYNSDCDSLGRHTRRVHETHEPRKSMIEPKIIKTEVQYRDYLAEIERLATEDPRPGTPEGDAHAWKHLFDGDLAITDENVQDEHNDDPKEAEANQITKNAFVPRSVWKRSDAFLRPSVETVHALADKLHINPAVIAGRLRRERVGYDKLSRLLGQRQVRRLFPEVRWG